MHALSCPNVYMRVDESKLLADEHTDEHFNLFFRISYTCNLHLYDLEV